MPSFDIVSEVNQVEVRNAVDQTNKEVSTRFDFKGSDARVEHAENTLTIYADDDFKLKQVTDILTGKLTKRGVDIRALKHGTVEKISGNKVKQAVTIRVGIEQELAKKIVKLVKDSKMKVQAVDPGRRRAHLRREARRPPERDRAGQEVDHRFPGAVRQLPRLRSPVAGRPAPEVTRPGGPSSRPAVGHLRDVRASAARVAGTAGISAA